MLINEIHFEYLVFQMDDWFERRRTPISTDELIVLSSDDENEPYRPIPEYPPIKKEKLTPVNRRNPLFVSNNAVKERFIPNVSNVNCASTSTRESIGISNAAVANDVIAQENNFEFPIPNWSNNAYRTSNDGNNDPITSRTSIFASNNDISSNDSFDSIATSHDIQDPRQDENTYGMGAGVFNFGLTDVETNCSSSNQQNQSTRITSAQSNVDPTAASESSYVDYGTEYMLNANIDVEIPNDTLHQQEKYDLYLNSVCYKTSISPEKYSSISNSSASNHDMFVDVERMSEDALKQHPKIKKLIQMEAERIAAQMTGGMLVKSIPKNIDPALYLSNPLSKMCVICNKSYRRTVYHYKTAHKDHEVFVARLSSQSAQIAENNVSSGSIVRSKYLAMCYFCEDVKLFPPMYWLNHIRSHTGEYANRCTKCKQTVCFNAHCGRTTEIDEDDVINLSTTDLMAFRCLECNFVQMIENNMHKHLLEQHEFPPERLESQFKPFILLPAIRGHPFRASGTISLRFKSMTFLKTGSKRNSFIL